jgi:hypothetical protein
MDTTVRRPLRRLPRLRRRHTADNVSSPDAKASGVYSEDTQIRTPDNGGSVCVLPDLPRRSA